MMNQETATSLRILFLCNSPWAIPAAAELAGCGSLAGVAVLRREKDVVRQLKFALPQIHPLLFLMDKPRWVDQLRERILQIQPDAVFVVTFPFRIPAELLAMPRLGFINFHFGALPAYAGNNPVFWQVCNREPQATVTAHQMSEEIDAGPVFLTGSAPIDPRDTFGAVCLKLSFVAAGLTEEMRRRLMEEEAMIQATPQPPGTRRFDRDASYADASIQWSKEDAGAIIAKINASNPWNMGAMTHIRDLAVRVLEASEVAPLSSGGAPPPGTILALDDQTGLLVTCREGKVLRLEILQTDIGIIGGKRLTMLGCAVGDRFQDAAPSG